MVVRLCALGGGVLVLTLGCYLIFICSMVGEILNRGRATFFLNFFFFFSTAS